MDSSDLSPPPSGRHTAPDPTPPAEDEARGADERRTLALGGHRTLVVAGQTLTIDNAGAIELVISLTDAGPVVQISAASLRLVTEGDVEFDCANFNVRAGGIRLESDGDLVASVAGDATIQAGGHAQWQGRTARIRATRGDAQLEASDTVRIDGARVELNQ